MRLAQPNERGDTIIEVLFAVAVFALVAISGMAIMNQGTATAQRSLEVTQVRQQIDAQAEAIRYIHRAYVAAYQRGGETPTGLAAQWTEMTSRGVGVASDFGQLANESACPSSVPGEQPFILNARNASVWNQTPSMSAPEGASLPPFPHVIYSDESVIEGAFGIWVEAVPFESANSPGYVDFHIRACWDSAGSPVPTTIGTIVRLYEP